MRAGLQRLRQVIGGRSGVDAGFDYVNPRRMNPRQQVMFFYLALVRRSQDAGLPREPSQTPYEYARRLDRNLPEVTESVDAMTEAFMEARYSRHEIPPSQVSRVRQWWEQVRKLLKDRIDNTTHKRKRL